MRINNFPGEQAEWERLCARMTCNAAFFTAIARYLNAAPRFITPDIVAELVHECGVSGAEAVCALLSSALGFDEMGETGDVLCRDYLPRAVRVLDPAVYRADPYFAHIRVPHKAYGNWRLTEQTYTPYEGFVCGPLLCGEDCMAVPPIGFFAEHFSFPAVMQDGVEWMAIKPNEIETMHAPVAAARGHVLAMGLGLGYYAYRVACKPDVTHVTVVERDPAVIALFCEELLPQFACRDKIEIVQDDALAYAVAVLPRRHYDTVFCDLWHDAGDGLPLYARLRQIEECGNTPFSYWIEDMLLSHYRSLVFLKIQDGDIPVKNMKEVRQILGNAALRHLVCSMAPPHIL